MIKDYFGYKSRNAYLKDKYGITEKDYERILKSQSNKCAICRRPTSKFKKRLAVDHNHKTGKVRGLLCERCNRALGKFGDRTSGLRKAYLYLKRND